VQEAFSQQRNRIGVRHLRKEKGSVAGLSSRYGPSRGEESSIFERCHAVALGLLRRIDTIDKILALENIPIGFRSFKVEKRKRVHRRIFGSRLGYYASHNEATIS
jgi:hypothetical protein